MTSVILSNTKWLWHAAFIIEITQEYIAALHADSLTATKWHYITSDTTLTHPPTLLDNPQWQSTHDIHTKLPIHTNPAHDKKVVWWVRRDAADETEAS